MAVKWGRSAQRAPRVLRGIASRASRVARSRSSGPRLATPRQEEESTPRGWTTAPGERHAGRHAPRPSALQCSMAVGNAQPGRQAAMRVCPLTRSTLGRDPPKPALPSWVPGGALSGCARLHPDRSEMTPATSYDTPKQHGRARRSVIARAHRPVPIIFFFRGKFASQPVEKTRHAMPWMRAHLSSSLVGWAGTRCAVRYPGRSRRRREGESVRPGGRYAARTRACSLTSRRSGLARASPPRLTLTPLISWRRGIEPTRGPR